MVEGRVWLWTVLQGVVENVHCVCSVPEGECE